MTTENEKDEKTEAETIEDQDLDQAQGGILTFAPQDPNQMQDLMEPVPTLETPRDVLYGGKGHDHMKFETE